MPGPRLLLFPNPWWGHWKCLQLARMWWVINYTLLMHQRLDVLPYWLTRSMFRFPQFSPQRWFDVPFWSRILFRIALLLLRVLPSLDLDGGTCRSWKPLNHSMYQRPKRRTVWKKKMWIDLWQRIGFWENKKSVQQQPLFRCKRLLRADNRATEWMLQARHELC